MASPKLQHREIRGVDLLAFAMAFDLVSTDAIPDRCFSIRDDRIRGVQGLASNVTGSQPHEDLRLKQPMFAALVCPCS